MNRNNHDVQHFVTRWHRVRRVPETSSIVRSLQVLGLGLLFSLSPLVSSEAASNMEKQSATPLVSESLQPQQINPPFSIQTVIEKAEHLIQSDPDKAGHYRVENPDYRVDFFPEGLIYYPRWDGVLSDQKGIRIRTHSIGSSILLDDTAVTVHENKIVYQRTPEVQEVYEARKEGVEQSWIIQRPLSDLAGDLTIRGEIETVLSALPNSSGGIDFSDQQGRYVTTYGQVTVIDHTGKKLNIRPVLEDSRLTITLPSDWLAQAVYPIVVDPLIGSSVRVDTLTTTDNYPAIAFDGTNYLIVWQTGTPNTTGTGSTVIRGARVSSTGTVLDATPLTIGDTANRDDEFPSVAYDSVNSRYIVVWMMWNDTSAPVTSANVYRNTVTTAGVVGTSTAILTDANRILAYPTVACCDVNNNYYVVYGRNSATGATSFNAYNGQTYNRTTHAAATASNPTGTVSSGTITPNVAPIAAPRLYSLSTTKYLLTWETFVSGSNYDVTANIVTVAATPSYTWGTAIAVANATTGTLVERYPRAAYDGTNALIVLHKGTTSDADIYGRLGNPSGASLTFGAAAFSLSVVAGSNQTNPNVAYTAGTCSANPMNRYMVVWQDGRNNATNPDIYGSPVDTVGAVGTAVAIATATTYIKQYPVIAVNSGSCNFMSAWSDTRNSGTASNDIYAQLVGYPNISNISPTLGIIGSTISINGLNFGSDPGAANRSTATNNVRLNVTQVPNANVTAWSDTSITFTVPTGTANGSYPVSVTAGSWVSNNNNNLTVTTVGPATQLAFTTQPGGGTGGVAWAVQPVVTIRDANGFTVTTATNAVTLAIGTNPNSGTLTCTNNTVSAVNGIATFAGCRINRSGTGYTLTASATGLSTATSSPFNITVGPAYQIGFTTQPGGGTGGVAWTTQPVVAVQDAGGNTVTSAVNSITLAIGTNPGGGTLICTTNPLAATAGVATFAGCRINRSGTGYTLTATTTGLTVNTVTSSTFNITVGPAYQIGFTTQPGGGTGGVAWTTQPVVAVQDAGGNTVTSAVNSITLAIGTNPGGGTLTCTTNPLTATAGVATFAGCWINRSGTGYTLTATTTGLTVNTVTSSTFNITVGPAYQIGFTTQPGGGTGGVAWTTQPVVAVQDAGGNTVTSAVNSITLAIGTNPGGGTLTCTTNPLTATAGVATFAGCRINLIGTGYTLTATTTGLTVNTVTSSTFNITVGPAYQIAFTTQPGGGSGGTAWTTQPVVAVRDAGGNTVPTAANSITLAIGTNPGGGTLTCTTNPLSATAGVATFAGCQINRGGNGYTLTATTTGLTINTTTSLAFNILEITTASLANAYQWVNYSVTLAVAGGNTPYTWSVTVGILPSGLTLNVSTGQISGTPDTAGTYNFTIQVTDSTTPTALTHSRAFTITTYGLTTIAVTPANPSITPGQTIQFTATGTYSDNSVNNLTSTVAWSSSSPSVATINSAGLATGVGLGAVTVSAIK